MDNLLLIGIITICVIFIIICLLKRRPDILVDFALRVFVGTAGIYVMDFVFKSGGYDIYVGINGMSILANGILGLPGFLLMYGLAIYYSFQ